jgi:hypothetical protein
MANHGSQFTLTPAIIVYDRWRDARRRLSWHGELMSAEWVTAIGTVGTFVVIAASALAALIQLRHLRAANQIAALATFAQQYEGPELRDAFHFVRTELATRLEDRSFRDELRSGKLDRARHPEITIGNFFEQWGRNYRSGSIDKRAFLKDMGNIAISFWNVMEPVISMISEKTGGINVAWENWEVLVLDALAWTARHQHGTFPTNLNRLPLLDPWKETDAR